MTWQKLTMAYEDIPASISTGLTDEIDHLDASDGALDSDASEYAALPQTKQKKKHV